MWLEFAGLEFLIERQMQCIRANCRATSNRSTCGIVNTFVIRSLVSPMSDTGTNMTTYVKGFLYVKSGWLRLLTSKKNYLWRRICWIKHFLKLSFAKYQIKSVGVAHRLRLFFGIELCATCLNRNGSVSVSSLPFTNFLRAPTMDNLEFSTVFHPVRVVSSPFMCSPTSRSESI